jgi:esterase FrsA
MTYQWPIDPQDLFAERYPQMLGSRLPAEDVNGVRTAVVEMWGDRSGGWVREWSLLASGYAAAGRHDLAALAYGWAKFPVLADNAKHTAFKHQIEQYVLAANSFPVRFHRRELALDYRDARTSLPVHMLSAPTLSPSAPVLIASGGVDTWKMDFHLLFAVLALSTGAHVLAFDIPGTGEAGVPLSRENTAIIDGLIGAARDLGNGRVAHFGLSMGGYFSAYSGLAGIVDAAVVLGGPVEAAFAPDRKWEFGMADIVGNAAGLDHQLTDGELAR